MGWFPHCDCNLYYIMYRETTSGLIKGDEIRACLDRRRLEEAHLKYAILLVYQIIPSTSQVGKSHVTSALH